MIFPLTVETEMKHRVYQSAILMKLLLTRHAVVQLVLGQGNRWCWIIWT